MGNKAKRKAVWKKWHKANNVQKQKERAQLRNFLKTRAVFEKMASKAKEVTNGDAQK